MMMAAMPSHGVMLPLLEDLLLKVFLVAICLFSFLLAGNR
jgi:hypothetical protein